MAGLESSRNDLVNNQATTNQIIQKKEQIHSVTETASSNATFKKIPKEVRLHLMQRGKNADTH